MRRRAAAGRKTAKKPRRDKAKPRRAVKAAARKSGSTTKLQAQLRLRTAELSQALEREAATAEILKVISSSPGSLKVVFQAMLENAVRICGAKFGMLFRFDGEKFDTAARVRTPRALAEMQKRRGPFLPGKGTLLDRAWQTKKVAYSADYAAEPNSGNAAKLGGARSTVAVPMLKDDELVGAILIYRQEVRPFTDKQIELLQNFAAQAVIAIENARLLNELRQRTNDLTESLEQQTATSEVLKVISSSPGELQPVFEAMLANATRLCEASYGAMWLREGDGFRSAALHGPLPAAYIERWRSGTLVHAHPDAPMMRVAETRQPVQTPDMRDSRAYLSGDPLAVSAVEVAGIRTVLSVPMFKEDELVGTITIYRKEVRPFTDKQIKLVSNFAAQAVIAIENTRLLNELRQRTDDLSESLEQQTATSEVLQVISRATGELEPVFQAMLQNAVRICEAPFGNLLLIDADGTIRIGSQHGTPAGLVEVLKRGVRPGPSNALGRVIATRKMLHIADYAADFAYLEREPIAVAGVEVGGIRSLLIVPMLKDDELIGAFGIYRQEVRPFTDKQIELVTNFAAQAVIAIENTRLLNELRQRTDDLTESLEQQTATSEVLKVISSTPGELESVFQAMLENAVRICGAKFGNLWLGGDAGFRIAAIHGAPPAYREYFDRNPVVVPDARNGLGQIARAKQPIYIPNLNAPDTYRDEMRTATIELAKARSLIAVPMLKGSDVIGAIAIYRQETGTFSDKQIELVQNFAAQAVIAIENARLLNELRESLQQQTATADVLKVISSSPGDLEPVFQAILESATRICEAQLGTLVLYENERFRHVAGYSIPQAYVELRKREPIINVGPNAPLRRLAKTKQAIHVVDLMDEPERGQLASLADSRTQILVPMLKEGKLVGAITIFRQVVRPFTDKQIELLGNFAAQAVIAIENTRLLSELRQSLEQQTATADVLKTISRSTFDLQTVLDTLIDSAARLCRADRVAIRLLRQGAYHTVALHGYSREHDEYMKSHPITAERSSIAGRALLTGEPVHIENVTADPELTLARQSPGFANVRTLLAVPLLREGSPTGVLVLSRERVEPFTEKQIELVNTFADQAVIAIENVRLFDEVQKRTEDLAESLEQQTATSEVLKVIGRSTFDLQPVFDSMAESAVKLCEAERAYIFRFDGKLLRAVASFNAGPENQDWVYRNPIPLGRHSVSARAGLERRTVQVADIQTDPEYSYVARDIDPIRTTLAVPMLKGDELIGTITIYRLEVKPFTEKQIALMETFADQAVIAIENVRLFDEIQDKSRQLAEASQHKSQFLANMSHELRTPLNAILGYTELIADGVYGPPSDKMLGVLKRLESNGKHLLGLINDVLDLSKIEAGQLVLTLADYSLRDVAHTVYGAVEPLAADKKLAFKAEVAPDLPAGHGDERRLTQVLLNLVGNAIKFTDAGEVVIKAGASNGTFNLSVRDTGPGISAADQAKLFQEFQQADNSITRKKGGTGLGLAISKRIVELHGGKIWLESTVGQGSTFFVTLPVQAQPPAKPN